MAFLLDDILFAPIKAIHALAKTVHEQATEELLDEDRVRRELRELYMSLETGRVTEEEFEARESRLVERLEEIAAYREGQGP